MDLPEFKVDTNAKSGVLGGIIGGVVGSAINQGITSRGEAKRSEMRMREASHSAGLAERLMRVQGEESRAASAANAEHATKWASHLAGMGTPQRIEAGQFKGVFHAPDKDKVGAPAPASSGASTPAKGTPNIPAPKAGSPEVSGDHLKDWGPVPGQLSMFDKSGRVSKGVASKKSASPKTPKQGELF